MKKTCKRALALLFALSLLLTLTASAFAEEPAEEPAQPQEESETQPAETPAEETETPAEETETPAEETEAPAGETEAPAEETEAPAQPPEKEADPENQGEWMLYVSKNGNDESGDGSENAPFQTLARAAGKANEDPTRPVYILLMTDLEMKEAARFTGRSVTILATEKAVTVTRAQGFKTLKDGNGKAYNPAMIELRAPEGSQLKAGSLVLMNVILDDAGLHEGNAFEPAQEQEADDNTAKPAAVDQTAAEGEKKPEMVQDAIISVGDEGRVTLGRGAELRNFGGLSAVHLGEKSQLTMEADSAIRDTEEASNERAAVLAPESAKVELQEGAKLQERGSQPEEEPQAAPGRETDAEKTEFSVLTLTAPEALTRDDAVTEHYEIPYVLSFALSDTVNALVKSQQDSLEEASGQIVIQLDPRLEGDAILFQTEPKLESGIFELDGDTTYDESTHTVLAQFKLKEGWEKQMDALGETVRFTCTCYLPTEKFEASTETEDKFLSSTGKVSLTLRFLLDEKEESTTLNSPEQTAETKMLGPELSTLVYDVNGGDLGTGPDTELLPAQKSYRLKTEPAPTHAPVDGEDVVFLGWSATPDETIYERITEDSEQGTPELIETVSLPTLERVTVYAVYSKDINGDGIPDYRQKIVILSFDGNGENAQGVPEPILHVVSSASGGDLGVAIPEQEPERIYFTFVGWAEKPDATKDDKLFKYDAEKESLRIIPVLQDKTIYAVWQQNYRINYDANGGENAPAATVLPKQTKITDSSGSSTYIGKARITAEVPTREGYKFQGWAVNRRGTAAYFAGNEVQITGGNVTLYAAWVRNSGGGGTVAPKTGDTNMGLYIGLLSLSALALAGTGVVLWKKRARQE